MPRTTKSASPPSNVGGETAPSPVPSPAVLAAARKAGLHYSSDTEPGIRRRRAGKGFIYRDIAGRPITDERILRRIRSLGIPPAYVDVWISPDPDGHIQATGRDARGRKQYKYHADWRATRDESKFARLADFARDEVDVAIRHGSGTWPGLDAIKLLDDRFTPLLSPKLLDKGPPLRRPADLLGYTLLRDIPYFEWDNWFKTAGVKPPDSTRGPRFDSSHLAVQAAEAGLGVALVNPEFFADEIEAGRLVQPFPIVGGNGKSYYLVYPSAAAVRPKIAAFRDWLLAEVAAFRARRRPKPARASYARRRSAAR